MEVVMVELGVVELLLELGVVEVEVDDGGTYELAASDQVDAAMSMSVG